MQKTKTALVTGVTGQDGSYLAELLLAKGYEVHGTVRNTSDDNLARIRHLGNSIHFHQANLIDQHSITRLIRDIHPDEVYNLAAWSFVPTSWTEPIQATDTTGLGVTRLLEAIRLVDEGIRFYQASSSEMFGRAVEAPQSELTAFSPRNPYAVAKVCGHWTTVNSREHHGLYACSGILFNHESPRRGAEFVTRKITRTAAKIKLGLATELRLGNLQAKRDWGFAGDYVDAMWRMLQQETPEDYVIGTGQSHQVEQFVKAAFDCLDLTWQDYVVVDPKFYRPAEPHVLVANAEKANRDLDWKPQVKFSELVEMMVEADLAQLKGLATDAMQPRRVA